MKKLTMFLLAIFILSTIFFFKRYESEMSESKELLSLHALPVEIPNDLERKLAWGLLRLDESVIQAALDANAQPYGLHKFVTGLRISDTKELSPYALLLEGYLNRVYMKDNVQDIRPALDQVSDCIALLITHNISVDRGVVTIGSRSSMRAFVRDSIDRLEQDQRINELDEEGEYALKKWQHLQSLIDQYQ